MIVSKEDFDCTEIGTVIWECYYDGDYPKIGKTFVNAKKIDKNGVYIISFVNGYGKSNSKHNRSFANKATALAYYKSELQKVKENLLKTIEMMDASIENAEISFDEMCKESEQTLTIKTSWIADMFSEKPENNIFTVNPGIIPELKFSVGEKVYVVFNRQSSDIYGHKNDGYKIVEDIITAVEVYFHNKDDIQVNYSTGYAGSHHMRGEIIFKTKEEAETYCKEDAQRHITQAIEKMNNIVYHTFDATVDNESEVFNKKFAHLL